MSFSALQRAENSSTCCDTVTADGTTAFQCSSASRKFLIRGWTRSFNCCKVSVLFSEPKIPHLSGIIRVRLSVSCFSALQRAENSSLNVDRPVLALEDTCFSALQRAENSSQKLRIKKLSKTSLVSVLFSEPKIPHANSRSAQVRMMSFSALQRAENSSSSGITTETWNAGVSVLFSEPKIPPDPVAALAAQIGRRFSALQRAENSSTLVAPQRDGVPRRFSALQRAENSSPSPVNTPVHADGVSVLFSEPKIPHRNKRCSMRRSGIVSVLFSEPKIPHLGRVRLPRRRDEFQCSSASRKFLTTSAAASLKSVTEFQCSSASRKFLTGCR